MAEELHQRVRREFWGYSLDEDLEANDLLKIRYQVCAETFKFSKNSISSVSATYMYNIVLPKENDLLYGKNEKSKANKLFC